MPTTKTNGTTTSLTIPNLQISTLTLVLVGDSPLLMHAWSKKAKDEILAKQMKKAAKGREAKDPEKDYRECFYWYTEPDVLPEDPAWPGEGQYGFPSNALKQAAVRAAKSTNMPMTDARSAFHVKGEMVPIYGTPQRRQDMVRVSGKADIRFRPEFETWYAVIHVRFNEAVISAEQVANLFNIAGFAAGIGDWRPEKNGSHGMFHVADEQERTEFFDRYLP